MPSAPAAAFAVHSSSSSSAPVHIEARVIPQGDGTFLVKPGKPFLGRQTLTINEAAARAGLSRGTIRRLLDCGYLEGRRPSPRRIYIYADSLEAHLQKTRDPEFWENKSLPAHEKRPKRRGGG